MAKLRLVLWMLAFLTFTVGCSSILTAQEPQEAGKIHFLSKMHPNTPSDAALLTGILELYSKCLIIKADSDFLQYTPVWPYRYSYKQGAKNIEIIDNSGKVVAQVGERISVGGGETLAKDPSQLDDFVVGGLNCPGPFWIM